MSDLENLTLQVNQLKRANIALKKQLKYERREKEKLRKLLNPDGRQHYRNNRRRVSR